MFIYNIYAGLDNRDGSFSEMSRVSNRQKALHAAAMAFPAGQTVTDALGRWVGPRGHCCNEPTVIVTVACESKAEGDLRVEQFVTDYKEAADQESVMVTMREEAVTFM